MKLRKITYLAKILNRIRAGIRKRRRQRRQIKFNWLKDLNLNNLSQMKTDNKKVKRNKFQLNNYDAVYYFNNSKLSLKFTGKELNVYGLGNVIRFHARRLKLPKYHCKVKFE